MAANDQFPIQVALVAHVENLAPSLEVVRDALQLQVQRDFAPVWGVYAEISSHPKGTGTVPAGSWMVHIVDDPEALAQLESQTDLGGRTISGLHQETEGGSPQAHVLLDRSEGAANQTQSNGQAWSVVASHEVLEMLVNPYCNRAAWHVVDPKAREIEFFALEIADPCESPGFEYSLYLDRQAVETARSADRLEVQVSDFVYPSWFSRIGKAPYHQNQGSSDVRIEKPFQIGSGANVAVFTRERGWARRDSSGDYIDLPGGKVVEFTLSDCPDWIGTDWIGTRR